MSGETDLQQARARRDAVRDEVLGRQQPQATAPTHPMAPPDVDDPLFRVGAGQRFDFHELGDGSWGRQAKDMAISAGMKASAATHRAVGTGYGLLGFKDAAQALRTAAESQEITAEDYAMRANPEDRWGPWAAQMGADILATGFASVPGGIGLGAGGAAYRVAGPIASRLGGSAVTQMIASKYPSLAKYLPEGGKLLAEGAAYEVGYAGSQGHAPTSEGVGISAGANVVLPAAIRGIRAGVQNRRTNRGIRDLEATAAETRAMAQDATARAQAGEAAVADVRTAADDLAMRQAAEPVRVPLVRNQPGKGEGGLHPIAAEHAAELQASGFHITSRFRTVEHNQSKGRDYLSAHELGLGFDAVPANGSFASAKAQAQEFAERYGYEMHHESVGTPNEHFHFEPKGNFAVGPDGKITLNGKPYFETRRTGDAVQATRRGAQSQHSPADDVLDTLKLNQAKRTLLPEAEERFGAQFAEVDRRIDELARANPDEAATFRALLNSEIDRLNAEVQEQLALRTEAGPAVAPAAGGPTQGKPQERGGDAPLTQEMSGRQESIFDTPQGMTQPGDTLPLATDNTLFERRPYTESPRLPKELNDRRVTIAGKEASFSDDVDKALYVVSQLADNGITEAERRRFDDYMNFLVKFFERESPEEILAHAMEVRTKVDQVAAQTQPGQKVVIGETVNRGYAAKPLEQQAAAPAGPDTLSPEAAAAQKAEYDRLMANKGTVALLNLEGMSTEDIAAMLGAQADTVAQVKVDAGLPEPGTLEHSAAKYADQLEQRAQMRADEVPVTVLGRETPYGEFIQTEEFRVLTSGEFLEDVLQTVDRTAPKSGEFMTTIQAARDAAHLGPSELDNYIDLLETLLPEEISIRLAPEHNAVARQLMELIERHGRSLEQEFGVRLPYQDPAIFFRALGRYLANGFKIGKLSDMEVAAYRDSLDWYLAAFREGRLTPEAHQQQLFRLSEIIQEVEIHEGLIHTRDGSSIGVYEADTGMVRLSDNAQLDAAAHEIMHGITMTSEHGKRFVQGIAENVGEYERRVLANYLGVSDHADAMLYAYNVEETSVRALQMYMTDPDYMEEFLPALYKRVADFMGDMSDQNKNLFAVLTHMQRVGAITATSKQASKYNFLVKRESGLYDVEAAVDRANALDYDPAAVQAFETANKHFREWGFTVDGTYDVPLSYSTYFYLREVFEEQALVTKNGKKSAEKQAASAPLTSLIDGFSLRASEDIVPGSAADALSHSKWGVAKRTLNGINGFFFDKLADIQSRAMAKNPDGSWINPHLNASFAASTRMFQRIQADAYKYLTGPEAFLQLPAVQKHLPKFGDALNFMKGKFETIDPTFNRAVKDLFIKGEKEFKYYTDAELRAMGVGADVREAYQAVAKTIRDMSSKVKITKAEGIYRADDALKQFAGKGLTPEAVLAMEVGSKESREALTGLVSLFHAGYYPHIRLGSHRVHVLDADGKAVYTAGADGLRDAERIAKELKAKYAGKEILVKSEPLPFSYANQLDSKSTEIRDLLNLLQHTEHGKDLTQDEILTLVEKLKTKSGMQQYLAERKNVPGWEGQSFVDEIVQFVHRVSRFEHGNDYKAKVQDIRAELGRDHTKRLEVEKHYEQSMGIPSGLERDLEKLVQVINPKLPHFRHMSNSLRQMTYILKLGFGNFVRIAGDVADVFIAAVPRIATVSNGLHKHLGKDGGRMLTERIVMGEAMPKALGIVFGSDRSSDFYKAFVRAQELGFIRPIGHDIAGDGALRLRSKYRGKALFNMIEHGLDGLARKSDEWRQATTFLSFYQTMRLLNPQMDREAAIAFAGEWSMRSVNVRPDNRPLLGPLAQGETGNLFMQFKSYLWNHLGVTIDSWRQARGTIIELPNPEWKPGSNVPRTIELSAKDAGPLMRTMAASLAFGGIAGVPGLGWMLGVFDMATGEDSRARLRSEIKQAVGGDVGHYLGEVVDRGLSEMLSGVPMSDMGRLMYPTNKREVQQAVMPAALSIAAQIIGGSVEAAYETNGLKLLRAVSPTTVGRLTEAIEVAANEGRITNSDGELLGYVENPLEYAKIAMGGLRYARSEDFRMDAADAAVRKRISERNDKLASSIADKVSRFEALSYTELQALQASPSISSMAQRKLTAMTVPARQRWLEAIAKSKDPELMRMRLDVYAMFWGDAFNRNWN